MTHSGFKTAQKRCNLRKKENNNKDYRYKRSNKNPFNNNLLTYRFASKYIKLNYILRTKYGILLNQKDITELEKHYFESRGHQHTPIYFEHRTSEENKIIQDVANIYYNTNEYKQLISVDNTHTEHSKINTKNRDRNRDYKNSINAFK
jgi:hypothetical protein